MKEKIVTVFAGGVLAILVILYILQVVLNHQVVKSADDIRNMSIDFLAKSEFIKDIYGYTNRVLGRDEIIDNTVYVTLENDYIGASADRFDVTDEVDQTLKFADYCTQNGIDFLYVNIPSKPFEDSELLDKGISCYANANADDFLKTVEDNGIITIDFTNLLINQGDPYSYMYRTDHHWNTRAGLYAARVLIDSLNENFAYGLDKNRISDEKFEYTYYQKAWLGETGKKLSYTYIGVDDYVEIAPKGNTHFSYAAPYCNMYKEGTFAESMMNESMYVADADYYEAPSWHYSYLFGNYNNAEIHNFDSVNGKNILLVKDSYSLVVAPFLAMCCDNVYLFDMRYCQDSLIDYIESHDIDAVIVIYGNRAFSKTGWDVGMFDFFR